MGRHMNTVEQAEIWDRYEAGQTFTEIAASVGRPLSTVRDYVARHGFRRPAGAACLVVGADVAGGPRRDISGAGSG